MFVGLLWQIEFLLVVVDDFHHPLFLRNTQQVASILHHTKEHTILSSSAKSANNHHPTMNNQDLLGDSLDLHYYIPSDDDECGDSLHHELGDAPAAIESSATLQMSSDALGATAASSNSICWSPNLVTYIRASNSNNDDDNIEVAAESPLRDNNNNVLQAAEEMSEGSFDMFGGSSSVAGNDCADDEFDQFNTGIRDFG